MTAVTQSAATLTWTASSDDTGVAGYGIYVEGVRVDATTQASYAFSGLNCGTSYTLGVDAYDAAGNRSSVSSLIVTTSACVSTSPPPSPPPPPPSGGTDTNPPTVPSNLSQSAATTSSISASWTSSTDDVGVVGYGVYQNGSLVASPTTTDYTLTGLSCGTSYTVAVDAFDAAGNRSSQASTTMTTSACQAPPPPSDTQPPSAPTNLAESGSTSSSITASWTASSDNVGVSGYRVFVDGSLAGTTATTPYTVSGLSCGSSHQVVVDAYDAAGNRSPQTSATMATSSCPAPPPGDTQPPSAPGGLVASFVTQSAVTLSWSASSDNVGVVGYDLLLGGLVVGTSAQTSYAFSGLSCDTAYTLGVDAYDAAGNRSTVSSLIVTTSACADTSPPSAPTNLAESAATSSSITAGWTASSDNVGVTGYRVFVDGSQAGTTATTSYTVTGSRVAARTRSSSTPTTLPATAPRRPRRRWRPRPVRRPRPVTRTPPSTPTGLGVSSAGQTSLALSWNASSDNVGVAGYGVYKNGTLAASPTATGYTLTGLSCGTSYTVAVDAFDAAGNRSAKTTITTSTAACPDTQPPTAPTGVTLATRTATSISISLDGLDRQRRCCRL